jgi:hypothetical protein
MIGGPRRATGAPAGWHSLIIEVVARSPLRALLLGVNGDEAAILTFQDRTAAAPRTAQYQMVKLANARVVKGKCPIASVGKVIAPDPTVRSVHGRERLSVLLANCYRAHSRPIQHQVV